MKKQLIIVALALVASVSAFGQGYVAFASTKAAGAYFAPTNGLGNNSITVGFMWANSGSPLIGSTGNPPTSSATPDWNKILNDPVFQFAQNAGSLVKVAVNNSGLAQGGWSYGASFPLQGSTAGSSIQAFVVAWSSAFATPQAAAAGGSFLGWGNLITYATGVDSGAAVSTFAASGSTAFGVSPVPEPATFALAGLGAAAMLIFRRRSK